MRGRQPLTCAASGCHRIHAPTTLALAALAVAVVACGRPHPARTAAPDSLYRAELLERVARDQAVRDTFVAELKSTGTLSPALVASMNAVDSANVDWLKPRILSNGLPSRAQVGEDGVKAALLLVQHADRDPSFQAQVLPLLEKAFQAGEVGGQELAMLTDRVAKAQHRPQRYGTQTTINNGTLIFDPIEDSAGVDRRRKALGLMPLGEYRRVLDSVYGTKPPPK